MKKKKNRKLLLQVGFITLLIFVGSLVFNAISDYNITKDAFLISKNEMIDRDLENVDKDIQRVYTKWLLKFIRENRDEIFRPMTEEEKDFQESIKGYRIELEAITKDDFDFDGQDARGAQQGAVG